MLYFAMLVIELWIQASHNIINKNNLYNGKWQDQLRTYYYKCQQSIDQNMFC